MGRRKCRCEEDVKEARAALHEAAKVIEELAKEVPTIKTGNRKPTTRPSGPAPIPRPVPVFPTGSHAKDVENLENAILKAGKGGAVLLKAKDRSGKRKPFNLTSVTDLTLPFEVSLKSEKKTQILFNE